MVLRYILILMTMIIPLTTETSTFPPRTTLSQTVPQVNISKVCENATTNGRNQFFVFLMICIFIVGFIGNIFAVIIILFSKKLRARPSNLLIASLACTDLGITFFIVPLRVDSYLYDQNFCFNLHLCRMFNVTDLIFHVGSVTHLFVIAIERFVAIKKPFFHQRVVTENVAYVSILFIWIYSLIWAGLGSFNWTNPSEQSMIMIEGNGKRLCINNNGYFFTTIYSVTYIIPLCIMGVLYWIILKVVLKQVRAIASLSPDYVTDRKGSKAIRRNKQEMRATKTLAIVYGAFVICWLPVAIITLTSWWCKTCYAKFRQQYETMFTIITVLFIEMLPPINSCLNPFVYIIFNKQFRVAFKSFMMKLLGKPKYHEESFTNESYSNYQSGSNKHKSDMNGQQGGTQVYEMSEQNIK